MGKSLYDENENDVARGFIDLIHDHKFRELLEEHMSNTDKTRGPRTGSLHAQIAELNPGEVMSKARAFDPTTPISRIPDELPAMRQQVRNAVMPSVQRAKETTGGTYTVEVGDLIMPNGSCYVVAVVTRVN